MCHAYNVILWLLHNAQVYIIHALPRYHRNGMLCVVNLLLVHVYNVLIVSDASICDLPAAPGPCRAHIPRWFYNSKTERCEQFIYGGCKGNHNNFVSPSECRQVCPCKPLK